MNLLRTVYYSMPPSLRLIARRIVFLPQDIFRDRNQLMPPRGMIFTGSGDFIKDGKKWVDILKSYGLKENHSILDIGSGIGRLAIPLSDFISEQGKYEGFDIMRIGIDWCKQNISSKHNQFNFTLLDLKNDLYRSSGEDAAQLKFPFQDNRFDFACATSVFTHMLPAETFNYLKEAYRSMKPGGRFVCTFFMQESLHSIPDEVNMKFPHRFDGYALHSLQSKAANVCYEAPHLRNEITKAGFQIVEEQHGFWRGTEKLKSKDYQDILVLEKP